VLGAVENMAYFMPLQRRETELHGQTPDKRTIASSVERLAPAPATAQRGDRNRRSGPVLKAVATHIAA
jgi:hypothetical protein